MVVIGTLAMVVSAGAIAVLWPLPLPIDIVAAALLGAAALHARRRRRQVLARPRPAGALYVSNFASRAPGAGYALLSAVCRRADSDGLTMCLDAPGALVAYYSRLGFEPAGDPLVHGGGTLRRLVRHVRPTTGRSTASGVIVEPKGVPLS